ncbi:Oligopeptide transporter [Melia azedarach]|uniref:Oligopeptide transporter n=1 Tax=Melia azedarach TaxID=155640 RepID=A0ACC1XYX4_MELAZ|nr:Oligopeptide transporter [Melia azedarach]
MENKNKNIQRDVEDDEIDDSPIEQVRLTVPTTDDPELPILTFRTWVLGPTTCIILAFMGESFGYRQNPISLSSSCFQMLLVFFGKLMAATLPSKLITIPGTSWTFSMNPGPFNIKEHVLLTILATSGLDSPYSTTIIVMRKIFYHKYVNFWVGLLMILTSQMLGYGFAGIFMKFLVNNPYMWYPFTLLDVSFYRSLHDVELRPKRGITKLQFFVIASVASFAYAIIPGYFFPSLSALSIVCWFWKSSVTAQLIGSGRNGFGIGSFALDWNAISGYLSNPLAFPLSTIINIAFGFVLLLYVITPITYWTNTNNARHFPLSSLEIFDENGQVYNVSRALNENDLTFNQKGYQNYSKLYLSAVYVLTLGFDLASITASLSHFIVFHGREVWQQFKQAYDSSENTGDVHNRLMKKYKPVPQWWFLAILITATCLAILSCEGFGKQLQLPYWGILLSCLLVMIFILPLGVLEATTGKSIEMNVVSEMLIGYMYPGRPIANMVFKAYSVSTEYHALRFISEFKLAHYMKIAPKSMFIAQITGTMISSVVSFSTSWWLISTVENICDPKKLPKGSPWTCPFMNANYVGSVIWGVMGPQRIFFPHGIYSKLFYFFLIGLVAPVLVWCLLKCFPEKKWIKGINIPNITSGAIMLRASGAVSYWSWITVGILYNLIVYNKYKDWWAKYNYVLAYGLDMGIAFMSLLTSFTLGLQGIYGVDWWGLDVGDHCPLAQCPTAPGVTVDGCPPV